MQRYLASLVVVLVTMFAAFGFTAAPAAAKAIHFSFTFGDTFTDDTCSFSVERHNDGKGTGRLFFDNDGNFVGIDLTNAGISTITDLGSGVSVTEKFQILIKNFNMVDIGNGTQTGDQTTVGSSTLYGQNGEVLLRGHGPMTVRLTIIPDPFEVLESEILFEHGFHADTETYCQVLAEALGVTT